MVVEDLLAQRGGVDMGVDFRCTDTLMAQHGLDDTQVGSAFEQCG